MVTVTVQLQLPDELAARAQTNGLLSANSMEELLRKELRRKAGEELLRYTEPIVAQSGEPMSLEEIQKVVKSVRRELRVRDENRP